MTYPRPYHPTTKNLIPYYKNIRPAYYDVNGNTLYEGTVEKQLALSNGLSYVAPTVHTPYGYDTISGNAGFTFQIQNIENLNFLKQLGEGKRAIHPASFPTWYFYDDKLELEGQGFRNWITNNWGRSGATGYYHNPWPDVGVERCKETWSRWINYVHSQGITIDAVNWDIEGDPFRYSPSVVLRNMITSNPQYSSPWRGFTSWKSLYEYEVGNTSGQYNSFAWYGMAEAGRSHMFDETYREAYLSKYPKGIMGNYASLESERIPGFTMIHEVNEDGYILPDRGTIGNAHAPILYGTLRQYDWEYYSPQYSTKRPGPLQRFGYTIIGDITTPHDLPVTTGAWSSFMYGIGSMRSVKKTNPNAFITPYIGGPMFIGEYHFKGLGFTPFSSYFGQSPPEVLHNRWYRQNIDFNTIRSGITGPDGSTTGLSINFSKNSGLSAALEFYYNGLTAGLTYIFSYSLDVTRGFTGTLFGMRQFVPTTYNLQRGLTYQQILPTTGPIQNGIYGISYPPESSGWTRFAWKFHIPSSSDPLDPIENNSFSAYAMLTGTAQPYTQISGTTTYIWNPSLEIESSPQNINIPITTINSEDNILRWREGPPGAMSITEKGYNKRHAIYFTRRGGNSGYYYELAKHCCLLGSRMLIAFNAAENIDHSLPGVRTLLGNGYSEFGGAKSTPYYLSGDTFDEVFPINLNNALAEFHDKVGGFTLTTADMSPLNYSLPYVLNGAPDVNGVTWWWRLTVKPGYTFYCNGETLAAPNKLGTWIPTSSKEFTGVTLTWDEWAYPPEPTLPTPVKEINFLTMSTLSDLVASGCTFSRGSTASFIGPSGYLNYAPINQPRFHYDPETLEPRGLLLEDSATNILNWSESFASTGGAVNNWIDTNLTRSQGSISPSGETYAIKFTSNAANGSLISTNPPGGNAFRTFSFWLKGITGNETVQYTFNGGTSWHDINGIKTSWNRFVAGPIYPDGTTAFNHHVGWRIANTGSSVEIWGAQLEHRIGSVNNLAWNTTFHVKETSYIPTNGATASRSFDLCYMQGSSFTSWFGNTYGTIVYEAENYPTLSIRQGVGGGDLNNALYTSTSGFSIVKSGFPGRSISTRNPYKNRYLPALNDPEKIVISYSPIGLKYAQCDSFATAAYGITHTQYTLPAFDTMLFAATPGQTARPTVNSFSLRKLRFWDRVFNDITVQQISNGNVNYNKFRFNPWD
jgi:hypothetical protein